jgi:hypothetical protein
MKYIRKHKRLFLVLACVLILLIAFLIIFKSCGKSDPEVYTPGIYPGDVGFVEITPVEELSDEERYDAYDAENDPARPVLDVRLALSISNLGYRPGVPRANEEPPAETNFNIPRLPFDPCLPFPIYSRPACRHRFYT